MRYLDLLSGLAGTTNSEKQNLLSLWVAGHLSSLTMSKSNINHSSVDFLKNLISKELDHEL